MPELPEVETVRTGLVPFMEGARIVKLFQNRPNLRYPFPDNFAGQLEGRKIASLSRRSKYLLIHLSGDQVLMGHLGMSGRIDIEAGPQFTPENFSATDAKGQKHDHLVMLLSHPIHGPVRFVYNDPRRFGFFDILDGTGEDDPRLAKLGVEPIGNALSAAYLGEIFKTKTSNLKAILLDQSIIAGLGNIYVCEALHRAHLSPKRLANTLRTTKAGKISPKLELLVEEIRATIDEAIKAGGSTLKDFAHTDGTLGYFQHRFKAYDRAGAPCLGQSCTGTITRITQSGRSTFYCPVCQR